jgi:hypothetical protein
MTDQVPVRQDGATITITGAALPLLYRATLALAARHRRWGHQPTLVARAARRPVPRHHDVANATRR